MRSFLDQHDPVANYDYSRVKDVLDMIIAKCVQMREAVWNQTLNERE
jgi:hypothetical protein